MEKYMELYMNDPRYRKYIDTCMIYEKKTLVDMLQLKTMQMVGDYYIENPDREEITTSKMECGCGGVSYG